MDAVVKYRNVTQNMSVAIIFLVFSIFIEILSCLIIMHAFPTMLMTGICILFLLALILFVLPRKYIRSGFAILLVVTQCVIAVVNEVLYRTTGELFTFAKLALAGNVLDVNNGGGGVFTMSMLRWDIIIIYLAIIVVFIYTLLFAYKHYRVFKPTKKVFAAIIMVCVFVFSFLTCVASVPLAYRQDLLIMLSTQCPVNASYKNYGYYTFYTFNLASIIMSNFDNSSIDESEYLEYLSTDSENVANDYTGISEDNNVILILCESLEYFGIDEYFTPNLYNLMYNTPDAMRMSGFYTDNKTNMSEGTAFLGTYSSNHQLGASGSEDLTNALDSLALPNKLKAQDSTMVANYYHGLTSAFYHRNTTFDKFGFDNLYFAQNQEADIKEYNKNNNASYDWNTQNFYKFIKDSNFIDYNLETFIPATGRFYTQYATISTHGSYESRGANQEFYNILTSAENRTHYNKMIADLEAAGFKPNNLLTQFKYYKAAMMDLDKTIGIIMDRLEATNRLDNTTLLLYADHNAYYDYLSWKMHDVNTEIHTDISVYNIPCLMYDKKVAAKYRELENITDTTSTIDNSNFMSVADIYPTLCNILGLSYNTKLAYGVSIFDDVEHVFITFKDSGYVFNDEFLFDGNEIIRQGSNQDSTSFITLKNEIVDKYNKMEMLYKHEESFARIMSELEGE